MPKRVAETDQERWGITYTICIMLKVCLLAAFTNETRRASELYLYFQVSKKPVEIDALLKDPEFVFKKK